MAEWLRLVQTEFDLVGRRLRGMAMIARGIVPNLVISQRVVDRVVTAAQSYLADETGETMVGLVIDPGDEPEAMPTLYVLDTIAPDETSIRRSHMFEQGDELQGDIFVWLAENWHAAHELGVDMGGKPIPDVLKVPLRHLGDWHKQPGYMIQPSGGDLMTALRFMEDEENDFDFLLVPIVTLGHDNVTSEEGATVNYFTVPLDDETSLRMDWWYIHRDVRIFQPITPYVVPVEKVPELTTYPWYIRDREALEEEVGLMADDGLILIGSTTILWEVDHKLPLEVCMMVGRAGSQDVYLIVTDWDYPARPPKVHLAPFTNIDTSMYIYDIFGRLWDQSKPVEPQPDFKWTQETFLVDMIASIEHRMGRRPTPQPVQADPEAVKIDVQIEDGAGGGLETEADPASDGHEEDEKA